MASLHKKEDYQIGIICALPTEAAAMTAMLDEVHLPLSQTHDLNDYSFGRIGVHNLVIACLPAGSMGNGPAATVANNMSRSFQIKIGLLVGIGGGVPSNKFDIRLGDVVVSEPTGQHGGVVQWDYGKTEQEGKFRRGGTLNKPPEVLRHALQTLKRHDLMDGIDFDTVLAALAAKKPYMVKKSGYNYQGAENDLLFQSVYDHSTGDTCKDCDMNQIIERSPRENTAPSVFYGNIASGNQVMKHGMSRDIIAKEEGVICFEMEAAGLMDNFPCLVIRGICDYADSHKNKIWQPYAAATAAAFARILLSFIKEQGVIQIPENKAIRYTILPFPRNPDFIIREDVFKALDQLLSSKTTYQTVGIWGLGGCGKTQVALEYTYRYQNETTCSVFWVRGDTEASFSQHYNDIARHAGLPSDLKGHDLLRAVQQWIEKQSSWLLVLDNVDNPKIFKSAYLDQHDTTEESELLSFVPKTSNGTVIWTSRDRSIIGKILPKSRGIELGAMTNHQSLKLYRTYSLNSSTEKPSEAEKQLLELLERLPLAIAQAAAFINETGISLIKYLSMLKNLDHTKKNILEKEFDDPSRGKVPNSVMKTWLISMEQIAKENKCAAKILNTIAFLDNQGLLFAILSAAAGSFFSEHEVLSAAGRLIDYSFLQAQTTVEGNPVYQEHRLVQLATQRTLATTRNHFFFSGQALEVMKGLFPSGRFGTWDSCQLYLPHALKSVAWTYADGYKNHAPQVLTQIGCYYFNQGQFHESEKLQIQALDLQKSVLGEKNLDTISSMTHLAEIWSQQGRFQEAEKLEIQVYNLRKNMLGEKHLHTIASMANIAAIWHHQGRLQEAEKLKIQLLDLQKSVLGEKHPNTIASMANLAVTWSQQGRLEEAEKLGIQVFNLQKSVLGETHPDTITCMRNLAVTWHQQGQLEAAEKLQIQVLNLQKSVLGENNPDTITSMGNLAATWYQQGRLAEAEKLEIQVLDLQKSVLGEKHPDTIKSMGNLAATWFHQGRFQEAEKLQIQVLDLQKSLLREKHPDTIASMGNLAATWYQQGRLEEAEKLEIQVFDLQISLLGKKHPNTITSMANLAATWHQQGRFQEVEQFDIQLLNLQKSGSEQLEPQAIEYSKSTIG